MPGDCKFHAAICTKIEAQVPKSTSFTPLVTQGRTLVLLSCKSAKILNVDFG